MTKHDKATVLRLIRDRIQFLEIKPGDRLNENALAAEMGVSRTPIREALIILTDERLVNIFPQSGTFISKIDPEMIKQLVFMRHVLETRVLTDLCKKRTAVKDVLEKNLLMQELAVKNDDVIEFIRYDDELHKLLFDIASYPEIWRIIATTRSHHTRFRVLDLKEPQATLASLEEHKQIVSYIESGDEKQLKKVLKIHHDLELMNRERLVSQYPDYFLE